MSGLPKKIFSTTVLFGSIFHNVMAKEQSYQARLEVAATVGTERQYGELDILIPLYQNENTLYFLNGRGIWGDQDSKEGNFGLGLRHLFNSDYLIGTYGFFDRRKTRFDNYFNQFTIGAELITKKWEIRANGYFPESSEKSTNISAGTESFLTGNGLFSPGTRTERALRGFDAELGVTIRGFSGLRLYAGGFNFSGGLAKNISGPRGRFEWVMSDNISDLWPVRISLNGFIQNDNIRGTTASAELRFRINFGGAGRYRKQPYLKKRMTGRVRRDVDIITGLSGATPIALLPQETGIWYVNNSSNNGDGSFEQPFSSLKEAESASDADDIIYVYRGDGTSKGQDKGIILKEGQQLFGNGVDFVLGGKVYIAAGDRPVLSNRNINPNAPILTDPDTNQSYSAQDNAVIEAHNNVIIEGLSLKGEELSSYGIRALDKSNITIRNVDISGLLLPAPGLSNGGGSFGLVLTIVGAPLYRPDYSWNHTLKSFPAPVISSRNVVGIELKNSDSFTTATNIHISNVNIHDNSGTAIRLNITSGQSGNRIDILDSVFDNNLSDVQSYLTGNASGKFLSQGNIYASGAHIEARDSNNAAAWDIQFSHDSFMGNNLSLISDNSAVQWTINNNELNGTRLLFIARNSSNNKLDLTYNMISGRETEIGILNSQNTEVSLHRNFWLDSTANGVSLINFNSTDTALSSANNHFQASFGNGLEIYNQKDASLTLTMSNDSFFNIGAEALELDNFENSQFTATLTETTFEGSGREAIEAENEGTSSFTLSLNSNSFTNNSGSSLRGYSANTASFTLNQTANSFTSDNMPDIKFGNQIPGGLCFDVISTCSAIQNIQN